MKGEMQTHSGCSAKQLGSFLLWWQENPGFQNLHMLHCFLTPASSSFCAAWPEGKIAKD